MECVERPSYTSLGAIIDECYMAALVDWQVTYAGHIRRDELFANDVRAIKVATNVLPQGTVDVMVKVVARRPTQHEIYFRKFRRDAATYHELH